MHYEDSAGFAARLDGDDPLAGFRDRFEFPAERGGRKAIYLCGNSLGLQPKLAAQYVNEELREWASRGVEGHFEAARPWVSYHRNATATLAALTGAKPSEVVAMNTLTVNLHLLMTSFYRPDGQRRKIVIESTAFPSDRFAVMSQIRQRGFDPEDALLEWQPRDDEVLYLEDLEALLDAEGDRVALLLLPGVQYYSGQVLDMEGLCRLAREKACVIGLDLAHAIGNIPMQLHDWAPDFAIWCTYKYMNSGPGAVGGAFVHANHLDGDGSRQLLGWWSHDEATRLKMDRKFVPEKGASLWQVSNPAILSLASQLASLDIFLEAGIDRLRQKSIKLTGFLDFLLQRGFAGRVESITPPHARGCQLSLVVRDPGLHARSVLTVLEELNVTADWREPNVIRVAPVPLYNSFEDVYEFTERLRSATGT